MTAPQNADPFAPVPQVFAGGLPGARHLEGRVVIVKPIRVDENAKGFNANETAPTLIADIIVVDGGPIVYGDRQNNSGVQLSPPTHRVETPAMFRGWMDSHKWIVDPCRDMLRAGQPVTVGIIEKGTKGNNPYFLTETHTDVDRKPRTDPQYAQRRTNAINLFNAFQTGQWSPPTPVELNPTPVAAAQPAQSWGAGQQVAQTVATGGWGASPGAAPVANPTATPWGAAPSSPPAAVGRDLSVSVPGLEAQWSQGTEAQRRDAWRVYDEQHPQQAMPAPATAATPWG